MSTIRRINIYFLMQADAICFCCCCYILHRHNKLRKKSRRRSSAAQHVWWCTRLLFYGRGPDRIEIESNLSVKSCYLCSVFSLRRCKTFPQSPARPPHDSANGNMVASSFFHISNKKPCNYFTIRIIKMVLVGCALQFSLSSSQILHSVPYFPLRLRRKFLAASYREINGLNSSGEACYTAQRD